MKYFFMNSIFYNSYYAQDIYQKGINFPFLSANVAVMAKVAEQLNFSSKLDIINRITGGYF